MWAVFSVSGPPFLGSLVVLTLESDKGYRPEQGAYIHTMASFVSSISLYVLQLL